MFLKNQFAPLALAAATAIMLSGCMSTDALVDDQQHAVAHASDNYPITMNQGPKLLVVEAKSGTLGPVETASVRAYLAGLRAERRSALTISQSAAGGNSARVAAEIASLAVAEGIPRQAIVLATYAGPADGAVHLSYNSARPSVRACGNWTEDLTSTYENMPYGNLGCSVQTNIAAMIDNPDTLASPAPATMAPSRQGVSAITRVYNQANAVTLQSNYDFVK